MLKMWSAVLLSVLMFTACNDDDEKINADKPNYDGEGKASFYITDAPVDAENVSAVVISIIGVEAKGPDGWKTIKEFEEPVELDLLSYQNGEAYLLTEEVIEAGVYNEVRLKLNIQEQTDGQVQNPGCYIEFADGAKEPLFVPGGGQSGYKAKGEFALPADGVVAVTLDFDVRKAVVKAGQSGKYILKPTIRLVANEEAGMIEGEFAEADTYEKVIVFAYADGTFEESEMNDPADGEVRFSNAVTSGVVADDNSFTLAFMSAGKYDLYFAYYDENGEFMNLIGSYEDVSVEAGAKVSLQLELDLLN